MTVKRTVARFTVPENRHRGFTIVELLVVISIIGILIGLMIPAVQSARESSRRTACGNNLRNQILALHEFHNAYGAFPPGRRVVKDVENSWCLEILPYLEQGSLYARFDRTTNWAASANNIQVASTVLPIFRCPSSVVKFDGDIDYGGMMGSSLTSTDWAGAFGNGVFGEVQGFTQQGINTSQIIDGTSQTICIAESADRDPTSGGLWITGFNCFSQDNGGIGTGAGGEIFSMHKTGAHVALADGGTRYLWNAIDPYVLGALCTRNLLDLVDSNAY